MKTNKLITVSSAVLLSAGMLGAVSAVNANNPVQTVQATKRFNYSKFRKKIMKKCHISKKLVNIYTLNGFYHRGNIVNAIKYPTKYARYNKKKHMYVWGKKTKVNDEYNVAGRILKYRNNTLSSGTISISPAKNNKPVDVSANKFSNIGSSKKSSSAEAFKQKVMSEAGITEEEFNKYTLDGYWNKGNIVDAIKNPQKYYDDYQPDSKDNHVTSDEYEVASEVLIAQKVAKGEMTEIKDSDIVKAVPANWKEDVAKYFIQEVNDWRREQGIPELKTGNTLLQKAADTRANELITLYSHTRPDGRICFTAETDLGIPAAAECLDSEIEDDGYIMAAKPSADFHFRSFVYQDGSNNWGHRDSLKSTKYTQIAVGASYSKGYQYIAVELIP